MMMMSAPIPMYTCTPLVDVAHICPARARAKPKDVLTKI